MFSLRLCIPFVLLLVATTTQAQTPNPVDLSTGIGQMVFGLIVVVALLLATLWLIKRLTTPSGPAAGLKLLGGVAVGTREKLVLAEVGGKILVLGVTSNSINTLHVMEADEIQITELQAKDPLKQSNFAGWLKHSLDKRRQA